MAEHGALIFASAKRDEARVAAARRSGPRGPRLGREALAPTSPKRSGGSPRTRRRLAWTAIWAGLRVSCCDCEGCGGGLLDNGSATPVRMADGWPILKLIGIVHVLSSLKSPSLATSLLDRQRQRAEHFDWGWRSISMLDFPARLQHIASRRCVLSGWDATGRGAARGWCSLWWFGRP